MSSVDPFNRLVKLTARAFYDDVTFKGENQHRSGRSDNRGIAVVVLDALTRRQWVREEDLARDLKLHGKQLRRCLRFFEEEKLITREHRKETAKGAKLYSAAVAATADGLQFGKEGEEKVKLHTQSYCCLDYAQIYDVVRYRLHRMKKKLRDELDSKHTVQEYICPNCSRRYSAFDAPRLLSFEDGNFHCENCNHELLQEEDKFASSQEGGDGDDKKRRGEKVRDMLAKLDAQLKPLTEQLNRVKDLSVPEFGTLQAWEARASAAARAANGGLTNDSSMSSQGYGATPMPYLGDTKVEVSLSGNDAKEEDKSESGPGKVIPPWMIKQGMNLTKEQRGEKTENDMESSSVDLKDEKKPAVDGEDQKSLHAEYLKAYYAAILSMQQQEHVKEEPHPSNGGVAFSSSDRQVGTKSAREGDEGEEDDDVEWAEEVPNAAGEFVAAAFNVDLNIQNNGSEEEEDDVDWEEG